MTIPSFPRDPSADVRTRRALDGASAVLNSLLRSGQLVYLGNNEYRIRFPGFPGPAFTEEPFPPEDGMTIPGKDGARGPQGIPWFAEDGMPGEDGFSIAGPIGLMGPPGIGFPGEDGMPGEDGVCFGSVGANPAVSVGLTAVNGIASTFLRSDGAPALSQSIVPTWTGLHTFSLGAAMGSQKITSVADPVSAQDAATKNYVDTTIAALDAKDLCYYCSTAALPSNTYSNGSSGVGATLTGTANGPLVIDGVTIPVGGVGDPILVAGEAAPANNGWYTITTVGVIAVSKYVLTRRAGDDVAADIGPGYLTSIQAPSALSAGSNNQKVFLSIAPVPFVVGTSSLTFAVVGATFVGDETSIHLSGATFSILSTWAGQTAITTLGTIGTGTWQGTVVGSTYGGTGVNNAGRTLTIAANSGTISFTLASKTLTVADTASVSGTNTGDQTITLTGGVTGSGIGSFAATVITNANLTGPITSVGNATSIASQTGTGTKFVMDTAPTIAGGLHTAITTLGIRDTSAAFDVTVAGVSSTALTAGRTLTIDMVNVAATIKLGFDLTLTAAATIGGTHSGTSSGTNTGDQTAGAGLSGTSTLSWAPETRVTSVTLWDGSQASRTLTADLSGTDVVLTFSSGALVITGALTATTLAGSGAGITNVPPTSLSHPAVSQTIAANDQILVIGSVVLDAGISLTMGAGASLSEVPASNLTMPAVYGNVLINGGFDYAQRQAPATITSVGTAGTDAYSADRWKTAYQNATLSYVRVDTNGALEAGITARFYGQYSQATNKSKCVIYQIVEGINTFPLAGQPVVFQCKIKSSAAQIIRMAVLQLNSSGTIDTMPGTSIQTAWGADTTDPTWNTNIAVVGSAVSQSVLTTWANYKVNVSAPADAKNLILAIWTDTGLAIGATVSITESGLYPGSTTQPWQPRPATQELAMCQRYYEKSHDVDVLPVGASNPKGQYTFRGLTDSTNFVVQSFNFLVEKRADPAMVAYDFAGTANTMSYFVVSTVRTDGQTATLDTIGQHSFRALTEGTSVSKCGYALSWTANADL